MKSGEELAKTMDDVGHATTTDDLNKLYNQIMSGSKPPNP
jgi:hypothetical protein